MKIQEINGWLRYSAQSNTMQCVFILRSFFCLVVNFNGAELLRSQSKALSQKFYI